MNLSNPCRTNFSYEKNDQFHIKFLYQSLVNALLFTLRFITGCMFTEIFMVYVCGLRQLLTTFNIILYKLSTINFSSILSFTHTFNGQTTGNSVINSQYLLSHNQIIVYHNVLEFLHSINKMAANEIN